jgi:hypothetical protein
MIGAVVVVATTAATDAVVKVSNLLLVFVKVPEAVQLPTDGHDTDVKFEDGFTFWTPAAKTAGCALAHTPLVDVMVTASKPPPAFLKFPTAVQLPTDGHDTAKKVALGLAFWTPALNTARRALIHVALADVGTLDPKIASIATNIPAKKFRTDRFLLGVSETKRKCHLARLVM